jgi:hypothetical protein
VEGNFGGKNYGWEMSLMSCEGGRILTKNYLSFKSLSFFFFFFFFQKQDTCYMCHVTGKITLQSLGCVVKHYSGKSRIGNRVGNF